MELDRGHLPGHSHHLAVKELDRDHLPGHSHHLAATELDRGHLPRRSRHLAATESDRDHLPKLREPKHLKLRKSRRLRPRDSGAPSHLSKPEGQGRLPLDTYTYTLRTEN